MIDFYSCHAGKQERFIKIQDNRPVLETSIGGGLWMTL